MIVCIGHKSCIIIIIFNIDYYHGGVSMRGIMVNWYIYWKEKLEQYQTFDFKVSAG